MHSGTSQDEKDLSGADTQISEAPSGVLGTIAAAKDKDSLIATINMTVDSVVNDLTNLDEGPLPGDLLLRVKTALDFLEQCLAFKDQEFTTFAKKRANEVEMALNNTLVRIQPPSSPEPEETQSEQATDPTPVAVTDNDVSFDPDSFAHQREEKILIDFAFKRLSKKLSFLRGDHHKVIKGKTTLVSGIHKDGITPFYLLHPKIDSYLRPAFTDLIVEKRALLERRIYIHTNKEQSDDEVLTLYENEHTRDIMNIVALAFDDWSGEVAKLGLAGLPKEIRVIGPKKEESASIGASLKKVFSFGNTQKKEETKGTDAKKEDSNSVRIYREWQTLESADKLYLSQHFSFSLFAYLLRMSDKQFTTEYECICQIVNQQEEPDVGPVIANLSRLYKFYDNIFFDLVILTLFYRKNKFEINMLQAACMSQNFVVDRLPLTMDELRRRPMAHAKRIVKLLDQMAPPKEAVRQALSDYFHTHETIHASKVGKRLLASQNLLSRQKDKMKGPALQVIEEVLYLLGEITTLKTRQEEESVYLGEEILSAIDESIERSVSYLG